MTQHAAALMVWALAGLLAAAAAPLHAQALPLWVQADDGSTRAVEIHVDRGWAAVQASALTDLGWELERRADTLVATAGEERLVFVTGSPFYAAGSGLRQLADVPYTIDDRIYLPLQAVTDALPSRFPARFAYDATTRTLSANLGDGASGHALASDGLPRKLVVVIDPGHGGFDPGTTGPSGTREKDVALGVALALQRALAPDTALELHLVRTDDEQVPLWERGELATQWKGPRPGIFVSLHANALPQSPATRGFETYVLSEARTEHEMRVAAIENSVQVGVAPEVTQDRDPELALILKELRNLDHQHWSVLLAELVQDEMGAAHPGPARGVKQAPLAVITNALMPAVLVELGFLTNRRDELLLADEDFQVAAAEAIARAVRRFFARYPAAGVMGANP